DTRDKWHEVLRLLCGMIGAEHAAQCVSELLDQEKQAEGPGDDRQSAGIRPGNLDIRENRAVFLAVECLQEIRELGRIREIRRQTRERLVLLTALRVPDYPRAWDEQGQKVLRIRRRAVRTRARGWKDDSDTLPWLKD